MMAAHARTDKQDGVRSASCSCDCVLKAVSCGRTRDEVTLGLLKSGNGLLPVARHLGHQDLDVLLVHLALRPDERLGRSVLSGDTLELGEAAQKRAQTRR